VRYAGAQFEDDLQIRQLPKAFTIDGVLSVPLFDGVRLVARAENLFDEKVVSGLSASGVEDLGTPQTFWLGLTFGR
jgi:outer membrane receptor protein involved in Fe transport